MKKYISLYSYEKMAKYTNELYKKGEYDLAIEVVYNTYIDIFDSSYEEVKATIPDYLDRSGSAMIREELMYLLDHIKPCIKFVE